MLKGSMDHEISACRISVERCAPLNYMQYTNRADRLAASALSYARLNKPGFSRTTCTEAPEARPLPNRAYKRQEPRGNPRAKSLTLEINQLRLRLRYWLRGTTSANGIRRSRDTEIVQELGSNLQVRLPIAPR
jgi:hypothetical protein